MYVYLWLKNWLEREEGQDLIEYSLIIVLIVIVGIAGMSLVGPQIAKAWGVIEASLTQAGS